MQDRPTSGELADAIREFLKGEILPTLTNPRAKFRTLVAMNALGILERESLLEDSLLETEHELLSHLLNSSISESSSPEDLKDQVLELNRDLAGRLRSGDAPEGTLECLKETVANKLKVASPRYLERYENEM
jgi:hypothetical protein